jgi:hypothetical protein
MSLQWKLACDTGSSHSPVAVMEQVQPQARPSCKGREAGGLRATLLLLPLRYLDG